MVGIQEKVCRVANRISTAVGFVSGSTDPKTIQTMFLDGFKSLEAMVFELSQNDFRQTVACALSATQGSAVIDSDEFTRQQCELLHQVNLHERTIANVGNHLVQWRPTAITADNIDKRLSRLEYVVACNGEQLANNWSQADTGTVNQRVAALHAIANGLAIMVVNTTKPGSCFSRLAIKYGASLIEKGLSQFGTLAA